MEVKTVLFRRDFHSFQGGHLKVFDYIDHVNSLPGFCAHLYVTPGSIPHEIWSSHPSLINSYDPEQADALFLAGDDWQALSEYPGIECRKLVINLIQGFRHFVPGTPLFTYLSRKAVRICVSEELTTELNSTNESEGPVYAIPNCIDHSLLPDSSRFDPARVLIVGIKQPDLAAQLANSLHSRHINVECAIEPLSRIDFLAKISESSIIVALPFEIEGFYLPALEAMAMGKALVCPDCLGNRSFCHDKINCLMPSRDPESIEASVLHLLSNPHLTRQLQEQAFIDSQVYRIDKEKERFTQVLMSCQAQT